MLIMSMSAISVPMEVSAAVLICVSWVSSSKMADMSVVLKFVRNPAARTTFAYCALSLTMACISVMMNGDGDEW